MKYQMSSSLTSFERSEGLELLLEMRGTVGCAVAVSIKLVKD